MDIISIQLHLHLIKLRLRFWADIYRRSGPPSQIISNIIILLCRIVNKAVCLFFVFLLIFLRLKTFDSQSALTAFFLPLIRRNHQQFPPLPSVCILSQFGVDRNSSFFSSFCKYFRCGIMGSSLPLCLVTEEKRKEKERKLWVLCFILSFIFKMEKSTQVRPYGT